jgi:methyltransferase (TIGR00027 family)
MQSIIVFEVDHPASQAWKRERIASLGVDTPSTLRYAPIDFENAALAEGLTAAGLNRHEPVFFGSLGVTQYLTQDTGLRTLGEIATVSTIENILAIDFVAPPESLPDDAASLVRSIAAASAAVGEPWLSFYTSDEMQANMMRAGFHDIKLFGPDEAHGLYLSDRIDGARVAAHFRMAKGTTRIA